MDACDAAWAAGLFEGEGYVGARERNGRWRITATVTSTDHDVVVRFHEVVGAGRVYGPYKYKGNVKPQYKWALNGWAGVRALRATFAPFLGARRLAQFHDALSREQPSRAPGDRTHCPRGHAYALEGYVSARGERRCRACARDYYHA